VQRGLQSIEINRLLNQNSVGLQTNGEKMKTSTVGLMHAGSHSSNYVPPVFNL
jgi:hypothetical protein